MFTFRDRLSDRERNVGIQNRFLIKDAIVPDRYSAIFSNAELSLLSNEQRHRQRQRQLPSQLSSSIHSGFTAIQVSYCGIGPIGPIGLMRPMRPMGSRSRASALR